MQSYRGLQSQKAIVSDPRVFPAKRHLRDLITLDKLFALFFFTKETTFLASRSLSCKPSHF